MCLLNSRTYLTLKVHINNASLKKISWHLKLKLYTWAWIKSMRIQMYQFCVVERWGSCFKEKLTETCTLYSQQWTSKLGKEMTRMSQHSLLFMFGFPGGFWGNVFVLVSAGSLFPSLTWRRCPSFPCDCMAFELNRKSCNPHKTTFP